MFKVVYFLVISWNYQEQVGFNVYRENPLTFDQCIQVKMKVEEQLYQSWYKIECRKYLTREEK